MSYLTRDCSRSFWRIFLNYLKRRGASGCLKTKHEITRHLSTLNWKDFDCFAIPKGLWAPWGITWPQAPQKSLSNRWGRFFCRLISIWTDTGQIRCCVVAFSRALSITIISLNRWSVTRKKRSVELLLSQSSGSCLLWVSGFNGMFTIENFGWNRR